MRARAGKPTLAQIDRWTASYGEADSYDGAAYTDLPTFAAHRRVALAWCAEVATLATALRDPFAPGSGEVIADDRWYCHEEWAAELALMGESITWGVAGADPAALEPLREYRKAEREESARRHEGLNTPERRSGGALLLVGVLTRHLAECAEVLSAAEKTGIVEQVAQALGVDAGVQR